MRATKDSTSPPSGPITADDDSIDSMIAGLPIAITATRPIGSISADVFAGCSEDQSCNAMRRPDDGTWPRELSAIETGTCKIEQFPAHDGSIPYSLADATISPSDGIREHSSPPATTAAGTRT